MRSSTHESNNQVLFGCFVQQHFRMACSNDLAATLRRRLGKQPVDLTLAQNFQMRVRFIQQKDIAGIGVEIGQDQQGLLQTPPAGREVQPNPVFLIGHLDLASFLYMARFFERGAEQIMYLCDQALPYLRAFSKNARA